MTRRSSPPPEPSPAAAAPPRRSWWIVGGLVLLAAALRIWRVDHGLPDFHDEAFPFREALEMWGWQAGRTDFNPHFFNYPTLTIYLQFFLQKIWYLAGAAAGSYATPADYWLALKTDPSGPVVAARLVTVLADTVAVVLAWRLAERLRTGAGWLAAAVVALAATLILTSREIYVDPVQAVFALASAERLVAYRARGGRMRLATAVVCIGLAAGAKYNAGLLVLPLAWVVVRRHGRRAWWLAPALAAACLGVFLLSSPYVLLDFDAFWRDFTLEREHMTAGHLGTLDTRGGGFILGTALRHLGPVLLLALAGGLVTLPRRRPGDGEITVWLALLPPLLAVTLFRMTATRYLVPLVGPAAVLAAVAALAAADRAARRWPRSAAPLRIGVAALLLIPVAVAGLRAAAAGADTTQAAARRWLEGHVAAEEVVVQEYYAATLRNDFDDRSVMRRAPFGEASAEARAAYLAAPRFRAALLPLLVSGDIHVNVDMGGGRVRKLTAFAHASQVNSLFYRPQLLTGVDWFVKSAGVAARYEADPARYPEQVALYRWLARHADVAERLPATASRHGPGITIYRLGERARIALDRLPPLDPLWWAETVPREFRTEADGLLAPPAERSDGEVRLADGRRAPWVRALAEPFSRVILPYPLRLAHFLEEVGRHGPAAQRAAMALVMAPENELAVITYARAATGLGEYEPALEALRRARSIQERDGGPAADLLFEEALVLATAGRADAARAACHELASRVPAGSDLARRASQLLEMLGDD